MSELFDINLKEEDKKLREEWKSTKEIFDGRILHVIDDTVICPNGNEASRELIRHVGAVCVVPITDDGKVIVERQFRYPIDKVITEIPAGKLDSKSEDPLLAAKRELREETGYTAEEWISLGGFYPAPAYSDELIHIYIAKKLKKGRTLTLKARAVPQSKKLKVRQHVGIRYESSNKKIATVSKQGKIKARKKGACYVYAYAQNGVFKKIKVVVK